MVIAAVFATYGAYFAWWFLIKVYYGRITEARLTTIELYSHGQAEMKCCIHAQMLSL